MTCATSWSRRTPCWGIRAALLAGVAGLTGPAGRGWVGMAVAAHAGAAEIPAGSGAPVSRVVPEVYQVRHRPLSPMARGHSGCETAF
jgi:hypothetical protein